MPRTSLNPGITAEGFASHQLPKRRTGLHLKWLARSSWFGIGVWGLVIYLVIVLLCSSIECLSLWTGSPAVWDTAKNSAAGYSDIVYFNFITILTIGYGDLTPVHFGRWISVLEALFGLGIFGLLISAVTVKILAAPSNTMVFSRFAYYCLDEQRFMIIFVNTTRSLLENVDISSYVKLGGKWVVEVPRRTPFIGLTVWTFHMKAIEERRIVAELADGDVFRCALSGQIGSTTFSATTEYYSEEILVIKNRDELTEFKGFTNANLASDDVVRMFHYQPEGSPSLVSFVSSRRKTEDRSPDKTEINSI